MIDVSQAQFRIRESDSIYKRSLANVTKARDEKYKVRGLFDFVNMSDEEMPDEAPPQHPQEIGLIKCGWDIELAYIPKK